VSDVAVPDGGERRDSYWVMQEPPGLERDLLPAADHGASTYQARGLLGGRRVLITGGDSGIGRAVTIAFAREGAKVCVTHLPVEQPDIDSLLKIDGLETVMPLPADFRQPDEPARVISACVGRLGGLDILINVAGVQRHANHLSEMSDEQTAETITVNFLSVVALCRAALPHLKDGSSIIITGSVQASMPAPYLLDYAASKAALHAFGKGLARQLAKDGIRVNIVAPGPIWTPLQVCGGQPREMLPRFGSTTFLGRPGQPVDVAPAYVYLASDSASFVTGEVLHVDGGRYNNAL